MNKFQFQIILAALGLMTACQQLGANSTDLNLSADGGDEVAHIATESLNGAVVSSGLVTAKYRRQEKANFVLERLSQSLVPEASADSCAKDFRQAFSACPTSAPYTETRSFDCSNGRLGRFSLTGNVSLTFTDSQCRRVENESVTREMDLTLEGRRGAELQILSASHQDYRGNTLGGGQKITKTSDGHIFEVLGMHRTITGPAGAKILDISSRTTAPFIVDVDTLADSKVRKSGTLEIIHNLAKYTVTLTSTDIVWGQNCSCPVGGSLSGTLSGSKTGTFTIEYSNTCGTATVTNAKGDSLSVELDSCSVL